MLSYSDEILRRLGEDCKMIWKMDWFQEWLQNNGLDIHGECLGSLQKDPWERSCLSRSKNHALFNKMLHSSFKLWSKFKLQRHLGSLSLDYFPTCGRGKYFINCLDNYSLDTSIKLSSCSSSKFALYQIQESRKWIVLHCCWTSIQGNHKNVEMEKDWKVGRKDNDL